MALILWLGLTSTLHAQCTSPNSPYGINAHAPQGSNLNPLLDAVQACGIGWIRVDFVWAWVEPSQDSFNWTIYDNIVAAAAQRGIRIYATIGHTPAWATSGSEGIGVPNNSADFYDVCFRAAQRYQGSIEHWGMWNEPNLAQFWAGTRSQYINDILKNGADAVHAANPSAKVCGPELAHLSSGDWDGWLTDAIGQAGNKLDVVTHHVYCSSGYGSCTDKLENPPFWPWDPPSVKQVLQATGWYGKPFWITEVGWQSGEVGEAGQASYYTGMLNDWFTGQSGRGWIHRMFFYELNDSQAFSTLSWGIVGQDPSFPRKPAFTAYRDFISGHPPPPAAPGQATSPVPANLSTGTSTTADLSWTAATCAVSYNVYFGVSSPGTFRGNQTATTFDPGTLERTMTYFWRIDSVGPGGTTQGPSWSFMTAGFPGDFDLDGDVDQKDFGHFQACLSGSGERHPSDCEDADFDGDSDVDQRDFNAFDACISGSGVTPDAGCGA